MIKKGRKITITFNIGIMILFVLYLVISFVSFFTTKATIEKRTIVGVNPVALVESVMKYQEPLTVILLETLEEKGVEDTKIEEIEEDTEKIVEEEKEECTLNVEKVKTQNNIKIEEETIEPEEILTQYQGVTTVGKIEIPKTGVDLPILNHVTVEGMKMAPSLLYETGELNQDGNNLIVGHNFRDNTLFSNNKKLELGDKIYITTLDGNRIEYTIYDKFITTPEDVSYIKRDTNHQPEITLSCCTDDDINRIIILAK